MKNHFGDEYPAAVTYNGVRMPLVAERRWTRFYATEDPKMGQEVSRFMDGSAAITFPELAREWPTWGRPERRDFCSACSWLRAQADYPDMLRYIMEHGGQDDWSAIAVSVGTDLLPDEAFDLLSRALRSAGLGEPNNLAQGISLTRHPEAERVLREHLAALWAHPLLWQDDNFMNWVAFGATTCIAHLIELGASPADFTEQVRQLAEHACGGLRSSCRRYLRKHYSWLE